MFSPDYSTEKRLTRAFFARDTLAVARDLIGKRLIFRQQQHEMPAKAGIHRPLPSQGFRYKEVSGIITETESYIGQDDPACHACRGKTPRNAPMFDRAGTSYVYLIYGMYHCLNFVTEDEGFPAAVLLRGIWLDPEHGGRHLDGPGKLCKHMNITRDHTALDMFAPGSPFHFYDTDISVPVAATPRIGIKVGTDKLWRFVMARD